MRRDSEKKKTVNMMRVMFDEEVERFHDAFGIENDDEKDWMDEYFDILWQYESLKRDKDILHLLNPKYTTPKYTYEYVKDLLLENKINKT